MMRLISFVVCLSLCLGQTSAQSAICNSLEDYNTHDLVSAYEWTTSPGYGCLGNRATDCTFYFSFCQLAPHCHNAYSACENSSLSPNITMIGALTTTIFFADGMNGFYANFSSGPLQNISNSTSCTPSLLIKFQCDLEAKWLVPISNETGRTPDPEDIGLDPAKPCETILTYNYYGACYQGRSTTPKPDGDNGLTGGAIFLIILFSVIGAYFLFGIAYNGLVNHHSGVKLIPHSDFWIGLPIHAIAGCRCLLGGCGNSDSSSSSPSSSSKPTAYDSV